MFLCTNFSLALQLFYLFSYVDSLNLLKVPTVGSRNLMRQLHHEEEKKGKIWKYGWMVGMEVILREEWGWRWIKECGQRGMRGGRKVGVGMEMEKWIWG